jgi:cytoskeleton protein RodZ
MQPFNVGRSMSEVVIHEMPEEEEPSLPEVAPVALTLGARLAAERESKEWPIEHVAAQLNLAPRQIQALETDNYAALPGMASVRGFVRAYAKLLKIDAEPLVAMIAGAQITPTQPLAPRRSLPSTPFSDNRLMSTGVRRRTSSKGMLAAVFIVVVAIAAFLVEQMGGWPALSQSLSSQIKIISAVTSSAPSSANAPAPRTASQSDAVPVPAVSSAASVSPATTPSSAPVTAAPGVSAAAGSEESGVTDAASITSHVESKPLEQKAEQTLSHEAPIQSAPNKSTAAAKNLLVLTLREDSWVEVKAGRNALIARLEKAGSTESLEITEPVALTLGNASGVDVTFRGNPLDIKSDAKNNVVRLSLK